MPESSSIKRKIEKENKEDGNIQKLPTKQRRLRYQFGPSNTLASSTPLKPIKLDGNLPLCSPKNAENASPNVETPLKPPAHSTELSSEDHVYWAPTPKHTKENTLNSSATKLPSSPLRESIDLSINPINTLPQRYSSIDFGNLGTGYTPDATNNSVKRPDTFPTFTSSKKIFPFNLLRSNQLTTPISNRKHALRDTTTLLNNGANEFGSKSSHSIFNNVSSSTLVNTPSRIPEMKHDMGVYGPTSNPEDFSSDFFDDSDDFLDDLDKVMDKTSQPRNSTEISKNSHLNEFNHQESSCPDLEILEDQKKWGLEAMTIRVDQNQTTARSLKGPVASTEAITKPLDDILRDITFDDFDDDDEMNGLLNRKVSSSKGQSQANSSPQAHSPMNTMTTQEKHIQNAGKLAFKQDIEETDTKVPKAFKSNPEDLLKTAVQRKNVHRFKITKIIDTFYTVNSRRVPQRILQVIDYTKTPQNIVVRDMWLKLDLQPDDLIHIVGESFKLVDKSSDNLLIWNPDVLLSATLIGDTLNCQRRSVLKTKLDSRGEYNMPLIVGEIVHSIFQAVLKEGNSSPQFLNEKLEEQLEDYLMTILAANESKNTVREQVREHLPYISTWFLQHAKKSPNIASSVRNYNSHNKSLFAASNILDIEENIWSAVYGLRGMIDVTIEAFMKNDAHEGKFIVPMELKSGVKRIEHEAQVLLYTLLMKDRYDLDIKFFMLVYTKLRDTSKHEVSKTNLKDLIVARNQLSHYLKEGNRVLPDIMRDSTCDRCFFVNECMTINKLMEDGTKEGSGLLNDRFNEITGHLDKAIYKEFYNHWDELITKEEATLNLVKKELFLVDSATREKSGKCLSNLILRSSENDDNDDNDRYIYTFERSKSSEFTSLNGTQLARHDRILVSDELGHFAICQGVILSVRPDFITISTTRRLKNHNVKKVGFNLENNQTFETVLKPLDPTQAINVTITYRIDKDEMFHGMRLARFNLLNLFLPEGDSKRRSLIVDEVNPTFNERPLHYHLEDDHTFNPDQIEAFNRVLSANDFSLLLGMPGTGKTTVIAQLIRFLVNNGKTILLTSYTHSAVDNILIKIKDDDYGIVRLGPISRIHPEVQKFSPSLKDIKTISDLNNFYLKPPVVATTCLGISDWVFNKRKFDYCIVDESSQVSMPLCLGPLALCDKFILVGDHYQLPPLVQNPEAQGLSVSLFKKLSVSAPESLVELTYQYRMADDIMWLSNIFFYDGRLKCGSKEVAEQALSIPHPENLQASLKGSSINVRTWMEDVLDPNRKVLFLNHDNVAGCHELSNRENIQNPKEAELIRQIVEAMILCGIKQSQIGVMSFYRAQLRLFHKIFAGRQEIEKLTADQFQGRDKDCIIISLVKSNDSKDAGSLLREWRRVNVAITRAKSKLIILGSRSTLQSLKSIQEFMKTLDSKGWLYNLPQHADDLYLLQSPAPPILNKSPKKPIKRITDSKVLNNKPLTRDIVQEMGL